MGAYYQNQVISKNIEKDITEVFVTIASGVKFMESQYALNAVAINIIKRLSVVSSEQNPAKVYCVCDYDESENGEFYQPYYFKKTSQDGDGADTAFTYVTDVKTNHEYEVDVPNSIVLQEAWGDEAEPMTDGDNTGYIVNKTLGEYLDVDFINSTAKHLYEQDELLCVSPLSLLTRKNKDRMGGGDIFCQEKNIEDRLNKIIATWYNCDIYWTSSKPSDDLLDITNDALWTELERNDCYTLYPIYLYCDAL